ATAKSETRTTNRRNIGGRSAGSMEILFRHRSCVLARQRRRQAGPEKMLGNTLCGSSSTWCEIPAGRPKPGWPAKAATSDARDQSAENKMARDKVPIHRNGPGMPEALHKSQTPPVR